MIAHVLVASPEPPVADALVAALGSAASTRTATDAAAAWEGCREDVPDVLAVDLELPDAPRLAQRVATTLPGIGLLALSSGRERADVLRETWRYPVADCVPRGASAADLRAAVARAAARLDARAERGGPSVDEPQAGESAAWLATLAEIDRLAEGEGVVALCGAAGSGLTSLAARLHARSPRARADFVVVPCDAIEPEDLGGATLAAARLAAGGTLLLEHPQSLDAPACRALLAALDAARPRLAVAGETPLSDAPVPLAGRLEGAATVSVPSLAERRGDVAVLAPVLLARAARRLGRVPPLLTPGAHRALARSEWRGGVRALELALARALALSEPGLVLDAGDLLLPAPSVPAWAVTATLPREGLDLPALLARLEADLIDASLERAGQSRQRAADLLGLQRTTLVQKLRRRRDAGPELDGN